MLWQNLMVTLPQSELLEMVIVLPHQKCQDLLKLDYSSTFLFASVLLVSSPLEL